MAKTALKKNSAYWQKRFEQLEDAQHKVDAKTLKEVEKYYEEAAKQIELDIEKWYRRFAKNNNISMAEARQWLTGKDLKEFKWDVNDYIKAGKENAVNQQWMKELENASAKFHISKLEALKIRTQNSLEQLCAKYQGTMTSAMSDAYKSSYYRTAFELQKGFGVGWDIAGLDQAQIEKIISKPWAVDGVNFSDRIWSSKEKLIQTLHNELTQNVMIGGDVDKAIKNIAKTMSTSKSNAARLVMTEGAFFHSEAQKDSYKETGVTQYQIVATLDSRTSDICRSLDSKIYDIKDMKAGLTAPPFHVRCRSTTVPYFDDDFGVPGTRAARDETTGETYYIPDNMTYSEWEQVFVNNSKSMEEWRKSHLLPGANDIIGIAQGKPLSLNKSAAGANPHFYESKAYQENCQRCVAAYELRRRGYDVIAKPATLDSWGNRDNDIIRWGSECFADKSGNPVKFTLHQEESAIKQILSNASDGERYAIFVQWKKPGKSHVFIAEKTNGAVIYVDPQSGERNVSRYFSQGIRGMFGYLRLDDKDITANEAVLKAVVEEAKA